jgi:hypothetical protein
MGANEWRIASDWPVPEAKPLAIYLAGSGTLSFEAPNGPSQPDRYTYDPVNPTPTVGGPQKRDQRFWLIGVERAAVTVRAQPFIFDHQLRSAVISIEFRRNLLKRAIAENQSSLPPGHGLGNIGLGANDLSTCGDTCFLAGCEPCRRQPFNLSTLRRRDFHQSLDHSHFSAGGMPIDIELSAQRADNGIVDVHTERTQGIGRYLEQRLALQQKNVATIL